MKQYVRIYSNISYVLIFFIANFRDVKFVIIGLDDAGKSTTLASLQGGQFSVCFSLYLKHGSVYGMVVL